MLKSLFPIVICSSSIGAIDSPERLAKKRRRMAVTTWKSAYLRHPAPFWANPLAALAPRRECMGMTDQIIRLGPNLDHPEGVDTATAIAFQCPALGQLLTRISRKTYRDEGSRWSPAIWGLRDGSLPPEFGGVSEQLKEAVDRLLNRCREFDQYPKCCDGDSCQALSGNQCRLTREIKIESAAEELAGGAFKEMVAPGCGYILKYAPVGRPRAKWRPLLLSDHQLRNVNVRTSVADLGSSKIWLRVFRDANSKPIVRKPNRRRGRSSSPKPGAPGGPRVILEITNEPPIGHLL